MLVAALLSIVALTSQMSAAKATAVSVGTAHDRRVMVQEQQLSQRQREGFNQASRKVLTQLHDQLDDEGEEVEAPPGKRRSGRVAEEPWKNHRRGRVRRRRRRRHRAAFE